MVIRDVCPRCQSPKLKKNGHTHTGKQNHHWHDCGRQCVQCCEHYLISAEKRGLIERLLVERISRRGMCRAVGVTLKWLLGFLVHRKGFFKCFAALPDHLHVHPVSWARDGLIQRLEVEADELASFVQKKANKQWVWIAMDTTTLRGAVQREQRSRRVHPKALACPPGHRGAKRSPFPPCFRLGVSRTMVVTDPRLITHEASARVHNVGRACLPGGTSQRSLGQ